MIYITIVHVAMSTFIYMSILSMKHYEIYTALSLRPTAEVPFPMVTISQLSDRFDRMGHTKKSGNKVTREQLPEKGLFFNCHSITVMPCFKN